jgi:hypothetical protein
MARSSVMCTPQTGSRTNRREVIVGSWLVRVALPPVRELKKPRSIQPTARRSNAMAQHSTTSQIKNRINREVRSFGLVGYVPSYARAKGGVKRNPLISMVCAAKRFVLGGVCRFWPSRKTLLISSIQRERVFLLRAGENEAFCGNAELARGYTVDAHVWAQSLWDDNRTIRLLIVFHDGNPCATDG